MLEEKGELKKRGGVRGKRKHTTMATPLAVTSDSVNGDNTSTKKKKVMVNQFGKLSLGHFTKEYILNLLSQNLGWTVLCEFASEFYRIEENMNICLRIKERYIKTRLGDDGAWITSLKKSEYETILLNLVQKNCEAVNLFRGDIPVEDLESFEETVRDIELRRTRGEGTEERCDYMIFAKDGVNIIGENIWEATTRKKLKLV